jgi:hypothetical protein
VARPVGRMEEWTNKKRKEARGKRHHKKRII